MSLRSALRTNLLGLLQVAALVPFLLAGVGLSRLLPFHLPGSLLGMLLLLLALRAGVVRPAWFAAGAAWLFRHLLLFFVPAAVGVVAYPQLAGARGALAVGAIAVSTAAVMIATGAVVDLVALRRGSS